MLQIPDFAGGVSYPLPAFFLSGIINNLNFDITAWAFDLGGTSGRLYCELGFYNQCFSASGLFDAKSDSGKVKHFQYR